MSLISLFHYVTSRTSVRRKGGSLSHPGESLERYIWMSMRNKNSDGRRVVPSLGYLHRVDGEFRNHQKQQTAVLLVEPYQLTIKVCLGLTVVNSDR